METQKYRVIVVELADVTNRRHPDYPNLYVDVTIESLEDRYNSLRAGRGPAWLSGNLRKLRRDLSIDAVSESKSEADMMKRRLIEDLREQKFTVNRSTTVWRVYVLELDSRASRNPGRGFVYVGMTSLSIVERVNQHCFGARTADDRASLSVKVVRENFRRIASELAPDEVFYSYSRAIAAEAEWADYLRGQGYDVVGGH